MSFNRNLIWGFLIFGFCLIIDVFLFFSFLSFFFFFFFSFLQSYVVYLGAHAHASDPTSADYERVTDSHYNLLGSVLGSKEKAQDAIFYSYKRSINGFAANLEEEEANAISKHPDVVSVFLNKGRKLHTTRSWQFLGLERDGRVPHESLWQRARFGEDTIIGNLDTGVWPESESFNDEGLGPIPSKWKGVCQNNTQDRVQCNRKLIGARYFKNGYKASVGPLNASFSTARDMDGHGTHTLSTAGGRFVPGANIFSYANGTAKGGSPKARVAAYKVCWPPVNGSECLDADIMAAFDAAIHDGVDVLSLSLGGDPADYFEDGIAIGSFHAVMNGITVVCSAGNSGPTPFSVSNVAPWILTVAASTLDREFPSYVKLGNNKQYKGQSLSSDYLPEKLYPLITSSDAKAANASDETSQLCMVGDLDPEKVKGKIVICLRGINARVEKGEAVREAGGVGMILANDEESGNEILSDAHFLPATHITYTDGYQVYSYINSTKSPVAYITQPKTDLGTKPAPFMAAFSSQGPNPVTPEILKPDITAPGVSILAAYSQAISPTGIDSDHRRVLFNVDSGTSMSCPHISGVVGLLKTLHPDWTPSAIRSAIMTSARSRDNDIEPITDASFVKATPFNYGSGHVRPNRAMDPGLIYDLTINDYLNFLCALGYNSTMIWAFADYKCPSKNASLLDFNYPSITHPSLTSPTTITRTVRNVGPPSTYTVRVDPPAGVFVTVEPKSLKFEKTGEEKTFKVTLALKYLKISNYSFGRLIWSDGVHYVRSPISVSSASGQTSGY
ncbi:subtilisin-like protease SBT5.3 [Magnolia sinica]|uniref:subtilisin-like protease SBT5.3 n=1 Tax=Magnolia sinica TaxID=86752 RepID=UPI002658956A|nr:subtilisin-like protease SBT5.3 [Magnolia sinica]